MKNVKDIIYDTTKQLIRDHDQSLESAIRRYLRQHQTTRLDIQLELGPLKFAEDGEGNVMRACHNRDAYTVSVYRDYRIIQILPIKFRPNLP